MLPIILDGLKHFPLYIFQAALIFVIVTSLGWLLIRPFARSWNTALQVGTAGVTGLLAIVITSNALSYLVSPPLSLKITMAAASLVGVLVICATYQQWRRFRWTSEWRVFALLLLFLLGALFWVTYQQPNFDEDLHRPVVESVINGNFPIRDPLLPFWYRQYDYHYGWQLLAANISVFWKVPGSVSLDIVKYCGLMAGFSLIWGMLQNYKTTLLERALVTTTFFLSGPFWFFHDAFTKQYLFGVTESLVGFSVFHNLQAVSWVSLFVFLAALVIIWSIIHHKIKRRLTQLYTLIFLSLFLAGVALTGEFQLVLIYSVFGVVLIGTVLRQFVASRRLALPAVEVRLVLLAFIFSIAMAVTQGGVLTGAVNSKRILDSSYDTVVRSMEVAVTTEAEVQQARINTGIGGISEKPVISVRNVEEIGFAPTDNKYISLANWRVVLPAIGLFGVGIPIFLILTFVWLWRRFGRGEVHYFEFIGAAVVISSLLPLVAATRYGDQNLQRGWLLATGIYYGLLLLWALRLRGGYGHLGLKLVIISLLVLSWIPTLAFNGGVFVYRPQIVKSSNSDRLEVPRYGHPLPERLAAEKRLFTKAKELHLKGWTFTMRDTGRYVTEQTGLITYSSLFLQEEDKYQQVVRNLRPAQMKALQVEYLYVTPELRAQLSPAGQVNLAQHFTPVLIESWNAGQQEQGLYRFRP